MRSACRAGSGRMFWKCQSEECGFYGGPFRIEGNVIVHEVDVSNAEQQVGKHLRRVARLEGTTLTLFAGNEADGAEIVWEKGDQV